MAFFKKPKKTDSVRGQLGDLVSTIGVEVVGELKETGKEMLGMRPVDKKQVETPEKSWADEWLKDQDKNKPPISEHTGAHSKVDVKQSFSQQDRESLKQVQARLNQMYRQASSQSEYGKEQQKKQQQASQSVYDKDWQERQEKQRQQSQTLGQQSSALGVTGSKRKRGDWMKGAKRKRQATPQELNRAEFRGSKGQ